MSPYVSPRPLIKSFKNSFSLFKRDPPITRRTRVLIIVGGLGTITLGSFLYYGSELHFAGRTIARIVRTARVASSIIMDYKKNFITLAKMEEINSKILVGGGKGSEQELTELDEYARLKHNREIHLRAAQKLLALFERNGGIYIKLGQHLASLEYVLPEEYCRTMAVLQNQAPTSTLEEVQKVFTKDLAQDLSALFKYFDPIPIGAASLAQVHHAVLASNGLEVAVKVQHHRLREFVEMDMFTVGVAVRLIKWLFPDFQLDWLADEMRLNLPMELDFVHEAHNAERISRNLRESFGHKVRVPRIVWSLTTPRILVMEYLPGAKVTDLQFMKQNSIDPHDVSDLLTRIYSDMIFRKGFVHCDPHPGNVFVRLVTAKQSTRTHDDTCVHTRLKGGLDKDSFIQQLSLLLTRLKQALAALHGLVWGKSPRWEMILLDHGLYREIADEFRLDYARLWKALIDGDENSIKEFSKKLGGGHAHVLFSCVLTQRSWTSISNQRIGRPNAVLEATLIREKAGDYLGQVADLLAKLPRPLLLLLKTNDLLRSVERILEANTYRPSQTFLIMGSYCVRAIYEDKLATLPRGFLVDHVKAFVEMKWAQVKISLAYLTVWIWSIGHYYVAIL